MNALEQTLSNILSLLACEIQLKLLICYMGRYRDSSYATGYGKSLIFQL